METKNSKDIEKIKHEKMKDSKAKVNEINREKCSKTMKKEL